MDITIHLTFLPHNDPDASLAFYRDTPGITDDERRTITEMMAKGNFRASRSSLGPTIPGGNPR
jgi:hypothetical protein